MNMLLNKKTQVDYLTQIQETNKINEIKRNRSKEQLLDIKNLLAGARGNAGEIKQIVLLNHQAPKKIQKTIKLQKEFGYSKLLKVFDNFAKELSYERNFCLVRTEWRNHGYRQAETRKFYCFQELDPKFKAEPPESF